MELMFDSEAKQDEFSFSKSLYPAKLLQKLPELRDRGIFLCGGGALALYLDHKFTAIKDFDFYVKDQAALEWFENFLTGPLLRMSKTHDSENALTFRPPSDKVTTYVQIIKRDFYNSYDEVFKHFDFSVCKVGYDNEQFYFGPNTKQHILEKKLVLEGKPTDDFFKRWFKYNLKGFKMPHSEVASIIKTIPNLSFDSTQDFGY